MNKPAWLFIGLFCASFAQAANSITDLPDYSVVSINTDLFLKPDRASESVYANVADCTIDLHAEVNSLLSTGLRFKKGAKILTSKKITLPRDFRQKFSGASLTIFREGEDAIRFLIPVYLEDENANMQAMGFIECAGEDHAGNSIRSLNLLSAGMLSITKIPGQNIEGRTSTVNEPARPAPAPQPVRPSTSSSGSNSGAVTARPATPPPPPARPVLQPPRRVNTPQETFSSF